MFRSEEMGCYNLSIPSEDEYPILSKLGELGYVEFVD